MAEPPTGTVTFLFTDIEGSTRLLQELGDRYEDMEVQHAAILRQAIAEGGGIQIRTEGDSFFATFPRPAGAVHAAVAAQRALAKYRWPDGALLRVRMGMHTGEGKTGGTGAGADYIGIDVNRAARIAASGHGGQVLISEATRALVERTLPEGVKIRDLGEHRLKDIEYPERLYDLVIDGLPADFPPIRSLEVPTNLPPERTSFIGREREVEGVTRLLTETRLLTLTGPGGTGKTRLALKVAEGQVGLFADGVFLVDLSAILDPTLVSSAIAAALRVREEPGRDISDSLADHLRDRTVLLVVDNFEQVSDAGPAVARLLDAAPDLTVLVTSRVPLHLSGEREYQVSPLPLPKRRRDLEALAQCEAVMLFVERASAVLPSFRLSEENAGAIAEITARVDGLPLAIELAASRLKLLDPSSMRARIEQRLPLLTVGPRDLPERQRTLRNTIEWSYDLLSPEERRLFARLSVFAGGWSLEAAEAVCGTELGLDVLDSLGALVDGSLVRRRDTGDDGVRFRMLETIREYAAERLAESGETDDLRRRHAEFVCDLVEEAEPHLLDEAQARWLVRLEREHDNIRTALDWATETEEAQTALRTAAAVWRFWQQRAHLAEGRARVERILRLPEAMVRNEDRVRGLEALGGLAYWQGDSRSLREAYEEALDIARELGDPRLVAHGLFNLSFAHAVKGDFDGQEQLLRESLAQIEGKDIALTAQIWRSLGYIEVFRSDPVAALELTERSIALHREIGNRLFLAEDLTGLAYIKVAADDLTGATDLLREAVKMQTEAEPPMLYFAGSLFVLALVAIREGRHRRAARLLGAASRVRHDLGGGPPATIYLRDDPESDVRRVLGDQEYEQARAEGYAMSLDEAITFALDESE
jgi:predicted ATPase/class 3 adenylate cyclase